MTYWFLHSLHIPSSPPRTPGGSPMGVWGGFEKTLGHWPEGSEHGIWNPPHLAPLFHRLMASPPHLSHETSSCHHAYCSLQTLYTTLFAPHAWSNLSVAFGTFILHKTTTIIHLQDSSFCKTEILYINMLFKKPLNHVL